MAVGGPGSPSATASEAARVAGTTAARQRWADDRTAGGRVLTAELGADAVEAYRAVSTPDDQWTSISIASFEGAGKVTLGSFVRLSNAPEVSGYACRARRNSGPPSSLISRFDAGKSVVLAGSDAITWLPGDTIRCEAQGSQLRLFRISDGIQSLVVSASDSTYPSAEAGIFSYTETPGGGQVDDFAMGGFAKN
jgi:hypothetical protein